MISAAPSRVRHRHGAGRRAGRRGAAAILAMMFLVIFGSLAAAMAIVSQGNLAVADSHMKINRSLAAAETGMNFLIHRLDQVTATVTTNWGMIDAERADTLWIDPDTGVRAALAASFAGEFHNIEEPVLTTNGLRIGPIAVGPGEPTFVASFEPHPLAGEGGPADMSHYDDPYYQRTPYNDTELFSDLVCSANPLDQRWIRVVVTSTDGAAGNKVARSISMDFRLDKKLRFAILSGSRIMIGRNVLVEGPIGSRFMDVDLANGHPIQMESDFSSLTSDLDDGLNLLVNTLATNDLNGDNRINLASTTETDGIVDPEQFDNNGDGYIDDYDFFVGEFDLNDDGRISATELDADTDLNRAELMELIDSFGDPTRPGYDDGFIDNQDRYAKLHGQVMISAALQDWLDGAGGGTYQDFFQGSINPDFNDDSLTFNVDDDLYQFTPQDFNTGTFEAMADGDLADQANAQYGAFNPNDPSSPSMDLTGDLREEMPYGSAHPYDYYNRPVYENMEFTNIIIPAGTNALFRNCRFIGVTFVETATDNTDPNYNYSGIQASDGTYMYPDMTVTVTNPATGLQEEIGDTKTVSNNVRFDGCTFEGAVVSSAPQQFTHIRNKISFTGTTSFEIDDSVNLTDDEKSLFKRSTILSPHYSLEIGTFVSPLHDDETVELSGMIVAGLVDMRGQIKINGSIVTTFVPEANMAPVVGATSPQFNTTLGYFSSASGDLEAEMPAEGLGMIQLRYDPSISMPDGITGPIEIKALKSTYYEGVAP